MEVTLNDQERRVVGRVLTERKALLIETTEDTTQPDSARRAGSIELSVIESILGKLCLRDVASTGAAVAGQAPPDIGGILGTILNSALTEQARREWERRPIADYSCLEVHSLSADRLAAEGIGPNDPGIQKVFSECARDAASAAKGMLTPVAATSSASDNPDFVVDGLAVGAAGPSRQPCLQDLQVYDPATSSPASHGVRLSIT